MGLVQNGITDTITIAGQTFLRSKVIVLLGYTNAANQFNTLKRGSQQYQVPVGKTLKILAVRSTSDSVNNWGPRLGYADIAATLTTTSPTGAVTFDHMFVTLSSQNYPVEIPVEFSIPSGKYPYILGLSGATSGFFQALCIEE